MDPALLFRNCLHKRQDNDEAITSNAGGQEMDIRTLGIDLAKNVFRVHGVDAKGRTVVARQLRRRQLLPFMVQLQTCLVGMEAVAGAPLGARDRETGT